MNWMRPGNRNTRAGRKHWPNRPRRRAKQNSCPTRRSYIQPLSGRPLPPVPAISPYLDDLLTRWTMRGHDLRKEAAFQKDVIEPAALAAHGNRLALRERRRRDLRDMEQTVQESH